MSGYSDHLENYPLWYKDEIIYELHIKAFYDGDGDGVGDFKGLTAKLDYLKDLGITAVWLLPFYPSPLKDDGYDIADYFNIHPQYGFLRDFKQFLKEAHKRGIKVITEIVLNHTSNQHPWFQKSRKAKPSSKLRNFYVWSDTPENYREARIIFKDFESSNWAWDPVAKAYYWHRFYSHQPDLNYNNTLVQQSIFKVVDFWLGLGVDGLRLDAVPYLYEREGTNCENLPESHAFLKELRRHVEERFKNRILLAEANQWPEDAVAYFGDGDECHMAFHFPLMPRLFMALRMEDSFPIVDIFQQTPPIPETCQWALFLRNHDELTLEMVTDEERDYMYRMYARDTRMQINLGIRRRLAPLLNNDRKKIELMNGLLFSLPGTPIIYYGDEIGMGDNFYLGDRDGVRTPMQWSADRNAGFSRANPQKLYLPIIIDPGHHYEANNVEIQQNNPDSLLWWMKRLIALRKRFKAFSRGTIEFLYPKNHKVLAFLRRYQDETILVVANLSRLAQHVDLNLNEFKGKVPIEVSGQVEFPLIGEEPYYITLGSYAFYWFSLEFKLPDRVGLSTELSKVAVVSLTATGKWTSILRKESRAILEEILKVYMLKCRWFGRKARHIQLIEIMDVIPITYASSIAYLTLVRVEYIEEESETYLIPLTFTSGDKANWIKEKFPNFVVSNLVVRAESGDIEGVLCDALVDGDFCKGLIKAIARRRQFRGDSGKVLASPTQEFRRIRGLIKAPLESKLLEAEQSNASIIYGNKLILKVFRRLEKGVNPDLEIGHFLTKKVAFPYIPPLVGYFEYRQQKNSEPITLAILHDYVQNAEDAWQYTLDILGQFYERVIASPDVQIPPIPQKPLLTLSEEDPPQLAQETIGPYIVSAKLLGHRTAELHLALASNQDDPNFAPESFSFFYQRSIYQTMRSLTVKVLRSLLKRIKDLPNEVKEEAQKVLDLKETIIRRFHSVLQQKITAMRIRCHGNYNLGQVLYTGKDFVIINFEGESARPISERRLKRSPLRDVAGMIRSFHYAAYTPLLGPTHAALRQEDLPMLGRWAQFWYLWVSTTFLRGYFEVLASSPLLPKDRNKLKTLLDAYLLEKAVYELGYELNNRPDWMRVPLHGILQLLEAEG
ncbi:MAG: maltose alpha-D-glucosyltransferase [Candidatus Methylarchaceae archaeon HK02M1]|nr:maltose alpha-D-glucosyltransferase [Candidatus Methylarchaceae archaeon HK02M1]